MDGYMKEFGYKGQRIRTVEEDGEVWWVLCDVCKVLSIENAHNVSARLDEDEKGIRLMDTLGGKQKLVVVNESGLYSVLLRSDKAEAKPFKRWVTHEVLPSIHRTGAYIQTKREAGRELVCDIPGNSQAQSIMQELRLQLAAAESILGFYNCYYPEKERAQYCGTLKRICGKIFSCSSDLDNVPYAKIELPK